MADRHPADDPTEPAPIVLLHGIGGTAADWDRVAPDLATHHRIIRYDQRGHGASGWAPEGRAGYTIDRLVADLAAVIDVLGLDGAHLIGHSMGGLVVLRYTLERPLGDRAPVRSLVLVDTAAAPAAGTSVVGRRLVSLLLEGAAAMMTAARTRREQPKQGQRQGPAETAGEAAADTTRKTVSAKHGGFDEMDPDALVAFGRELGDYPSLVERLPEIQVPTTVIVGEHDAGLRAAADTLAQTIPRARLAVIGGAGHNPHASRPLAVLTALDAHFGRRDRPDPRREVRAPEP
jgi:pimeloyl-ACP methyl ester carboxylesterase